MTEVNYSRLDLLKRDCYREGCLTSIKHQQKILLRIEKDARFNTIIKVMACSIPCIALATLLATSMRAPYFPSSKAFAITMVLEGAFLCGSFFGAIIALNKMHLPKQEKRRKEEACNYLKKPLTKEGYQADWAKFEKDRLPKECKQFFSKQDWPRFWTDKQGL